MSRCPRASGAPSSGSTRSAQPSSTIGDDTYHGRLTDISVLGAGLDVALPGPESIEEGALVVRDALGALLPATRVRVAYRHHPTGQRVRIGVEFSDPRGVAEATRRLIDQLNAAR